MCITPRPIGLTLLLLVAQTVWGANCPCSVWSPTTTPGTVDSGDASAVELGMKFRSDAAGYITGVRFYKATANTGTHVGHLWTISGSLLGSVTFTNETASGWQQANFSTAIAISASTDYVISYSAPVGHYSDNSSFFTTSVDNPPLHALANGTDGPNGVYIYTIGAFPNLTYNSANYWVDPVFNWTSTQTWTISGTVSPATSGSGTLLTLSGTSSGTVTANSSGNFSFAGLANGSYTVTPSLAGYTFSPTSQAVTINGANPASITFTAIAQTWTLSGTISPSTSGSGALLTLSGTSSGTTTANSSGAFSFAGLANGSYTVTPSLGGSQKLAGHLKRYIVRYRHG